MLLIEFLEIDISVLVSRDSSNGCISRFPFKPRYDGDKSLWGFMHVSKHYRLGKWHLLLVFRASNSRWQKLVMRLVHVWVGSEVEVYMYIRILLRTKAVVVEGGVLLQARRALYVGEATEYDQPAIASDTLQDLCILPLISLPTLFYPSHHPVHSTRPMYTLGSEGLGEIAMDKWLAKWNKLGPQRGYAHCSRKSPNINIIWRVSEGRLARVDCLSNC